MDKENQTTQTPKSNTSMIMVGVLVSVVLVAVVGMQMMNKPSAPAVETQPAAQNTPAAMMEATISTMDTAGYKDGMYSEEGSYKTPAGMKKVKVDVTLKDGKIVDSTVTGLAEDEKSIGFQKIFVENYKPLITGKSISEVKLDKVSGSSLTSAGFNEALQKIATAAKS